MTALEELLAAAERHVRRSVVPLPALGLNRRGVAHDALAQQQAAWPALAAALVHAVTSLVPPDVTSPEVRKVILPLLAEIQALPVAEEATPEPAFMAATQAVGAAGDYALSHQVRDTAMVTRLLGVLQQASTVTAIYTEAAGRRDSVWRRLAASAEYAAQTDHGLEEASRTRLDRREGPLSEAITAWGAAVEDILDHPSTHTQAWVAIALRFGAIAAAHDTVTAEQSRVPAAWRDAAQAWPSHVQRVGAPHEAFATATPVLDAALRAAVADPSPADRDALRHAVQTVLPRLGRRFEGATARLLHAQVPFIAARALAREPAPLPFEHLQAVRRGGWVPLPRDSHTATTIRHAASYATATTRAQATRRAATLTRAEVSAVLVDQESVASATAQSVTTSLRGLEPSRDLSPHVMPPPRR